MCIKKIYYNTYADGAQDVTEEVYPCREGRVSHVPEVRKYNRKLPFGKGSHFLGDLPTPRPSKSPSPASRRDSVTYIPGSGLTDPAKSSKHHGHHDRHDHHHRRSSRHLDVELDLPSSPKLTRSLTSPHIPHYVVIDQDQSRFKHRDIPLGPVHIANEHGGHRRHSSRDHESSGVHIHRRNSVNPQSYVVVNDNREHRRQDRRERRMSTSEAIPPAAPPAPDVHPGSPRRFGRRAATVVHSSDSSNATSSASSPPKHVRWEEKMRLARDQHNAEIAGRNAPPEAQQQPASRLKGILKRATTGDWRGKARDSHSGAAAQEPRRAVERMDLPKVRPREDLDLFDHDRLRARFGSDEEGDRDRERRRRSKVWVAGDRYQYL